jgi:trimethylamine--corrinoid protein Co-methyltransferase
MASERPGIEPIITPYQLHFLSADQLNDLQDATLKVLETVGVQFPSHVALEIFAEHGAEVDFQRQVVRISPELVKKALETVPRYPLMAGRDSQFDLQTREGTTYFTNDGCGHQTVDFYSGERRASTKADLEMMARVEDYLSAISLFWTIVSAQDCGIASPLHEIEVAWNNCGKHYQSVTMMGARRCRYAVEMATILRGSREEVRRRPPLSMVCCSIAPLVQDKDAIEGALIFAEAGLPIAFMSMPTIGTTAPATYAGALTVGDAEVISAVVLMQLASPGAPVFHSLLHAWADPRTAAYVGYPLDSRVRFAPVEMAHHWGLPSLGGAFGTTSIELDDWQSAAEIATDPLLVGLAGAEIVTGIGLRDTYTLLYPEAIILDADLYHRARYSLLEMEVSPETLALDVISSVGPGGHFLSQKHTRTHMRTSLVRGVMHQLDSSQKYQNPRDYARDQISWILENHHPQPLDEPVHAAIKRIIQVASKELERES